MLVDPRNTIRSASDRGRRRVRTTCRALSTTVVLHLRVVKLRGVGDFVERPAVEIDVAQMLRLVDAVVRGVQPVAEDRLAVGVESAEERVRQGDAPYVAAVAHPGVDTFRALDDRMLAVGGAVGDALEVADAAMGGVDLLAVDAVMDDDSVAGPGDGRGLGDRGEGVQDVADGEVVAVGTHMILECHCASQLLVVEVVEGGPPRRIRSNRPRPDPRMLR